jgi:hypothetical protein
VEKRDKESNRAPPNAATKEVNFFLIDTIEEDKDIEHERDNGKNEEKTKTTGVDEQPSTSSPTLEE